jgi:hypothetical protein
LISRTRSFSPTVPRSPSLSSRTNRDTTRCTILQHTNNAQHPQPYRVHGKSTQAHVTHKCRGRGHPHPKPGARGWEWEVFVSKTKEQMLRRDRRPLANIVGTHRVNLDRARVRRSAEAFGSPYTRNKMSMRCCVALVSCRSSDGTLFCLANRMKPAVHNAWRSSLLRGKFKTVHVRERGRRERGGRGFKHLRQHGGRGGWKVEWTHGNTPTRQE